MDTNSSSTCFRNPSWLKSQVFSILNFYYPRCMDDANVGYYNCFLDDGAICDRRSKHLVSTARFIYNFSVGAILGGHPAWYVNGLERGLHYLQRYHLDPVNGGYFWTLDGRQVTDAAKYAYGHAFVLLSAARAALRPGKSSRTPTMCWSGISGNRTIVFIATRSVRTGQRFSLTADRMRICIFAKR